LTVVGEAASGDEAIAKTEETRPHVVVMDLSMPGIGGLEATRRIHEQWPATKVMVLTAHEDPAYVRKLMDAGASGYLLKRTAAEELVEAVRALAKGNIYLDAHITAPGVGVPGTSEQSTTPANPLSEREEAVLRSIAEGFSNKQIASKMGISVKTVETYKARALEKLDFRSRVQLVQYAVQQGWLNPPA
jgi:DNA-binding NarL/FixJ family response regulator